MPTTPLTLVRVYLGTPFCESYVTTLHGAVGGETSIDGEQEIFAHMLLEAAERLDEYGRCGLGNASIGVFA